MNDAIFAAFEKMIDEDSEIAAIYIGEDGKNQMPNVLPKN